tara:strand:+ start:1224 stop:2438 length:1215 start_codon:yes stop_codon:yes gene_type:complete
MKGWYYGWNVLGVSMLFQAIIFGIAFFSFTFYVEPWREEFGVSRGDIFLALVTVQIIMGLASPIAGKAMDRMSIRGLVITGSVSYATFLAISSLATSLWHIVGLYGTLFVVGALLAGPLAAQTLAAKWFFKRRGMAIGLVSVGTSLGGFIMPLIVTSLMAEFGWRIANQILSIVVLVTIIPIVWKVIRNTPVDKGIQPEIGTEGEDEPNSQKALSTISIIKNRAFWVPVIAFVPMMTAFGAVQQNFAPFVADLQVSAQEASYLVSLMAIVMVIGKVFFGLMADRIDHRLLYTLAISVLSITLLLMMMSPSYGQLFLIAGMVGFAAGGFLPLLGAIIGSHFGPQAFGQVMGLIGPFTTIAAIGPWIAGYLRDVQGSYDAAWQGFLVVMIPAALIIILLKPKKQAL